MENSNVELVEILNKLSQIQFYKVVGKSLSNDEWEASVQVDFNSMIAKTESGRVQLVIYAKYKGGIAVRWGSESVEQNDMIAEWFMREESKTYKAEMKKQDHDSEVAELIFKSL